MNERPNRFPLWVTIIAMCGLPLPEPTQALDQSPAKGGHGVGVPIAEPTEEFVRSDADARGVTTKPDAHGCRARNAEDWIAERFSGAATVTGDLTGRTRLETPAWVRDATATEAKYAFAIEASPAPNDSAVAFTNVRIANLRSFDGFGAGIYSARRNLDLELYLSNVHIEPNWPPWEGYGTTNYDGIALDRAMAIYANSLTIKNWNADSAIDNKAQVSQFVGLHVEGAGHRPLRYWGSGPHYLVDSVIEKPGGGTLVWFEDCDATSLFVFGSTFNGLKRLTPEMVQCENGEVPDIVYLSEDPARTGELHPMFGQCTK